MDRQPIIEARGVRKSFGSTRVIRGVNLNLNQGEILSIMGPSGSGKSTLLYCLAGIVSVDDGRVGYSKRNIGTLSQEDKVKLRRSDFGFIFQFGELVPELPVRDNVALPLLLRGEKKREAYEIADRWISTVGIDDVAQSLPQTLSGGETQRASIARAMAVSPKVIFADEPTGSLDSVNSKKIMELLIFMARQHDIAIIIVTHSEKIATHADRVVMLQDGLIESVTSKTRQ